MRQKILTTIICIAMCFCSSISTFAAESSTNIVDDADLFTESEEKKLNEICENVKEKYDFNLFVLTIDENPYSGYESTRTYIENYGEKNMGNEYVGLIIDMENRGYAFDIFGERLFDRYFDDIQIEMEDTLVDNLSDDDYYEAAHDFLEDVDYYYVNYDEYYDNIERNQKLGLLLRVEAFCLILSIVFAFIGSSVKISQHKEKKIKTEGKDYIDGNLNLTKKEDRYMREYTTKTKRSTDSGSSGSSSGRRTSTHRSSSGRSHSGRSGRF